MVSREPKSNMLLSQMETNNDRTVYCEDAIQWLQRSEIPKDYALVASLPDISEFNSYSLSQWTDWFLSTATLILSKTPENSLAVFYQSDIKVDGLWIDKGYLCQKAAEIYGAKLIFHKIACRAAPGIATHSRPGYSHILAFSKGLRPDSNDSAADVIPDLGEKTWERGMGLNACVLISKFIKSHTTASTVLNPFCGQGAMLAAANALGLSAVGVERSPKRAEIARSLGVNLAERRWVS